MRVNWKINNGDKVKDIVTGFVGVVVGRAEYLTGCRQVCVSPAVRGGKCEDARWFDEDRVKLVKTRAVIVPIVNAGGPVATPPPAR